MVILIHHWIYVMIWNPLRTKGLWKKIRHDFIEFYFISLYIVIERTGDNFALLLKKLKFTHNSILFTFIHRCSTSYLQLHYKNIYLKININSSGSNLIRIFLKSASAFFWTIIYFSIFRKTVALEKFLFAESGLALNAFSICEWFNKIRPECIKEFPK